MAAIMTMTMEEYNRWMHNDNGSGLVPPTISATVNFELKRHILTILKDIPFSRKDHVIDILMNFCTVKTILIFQMLHKIQCR